MNKSSLKMLGGFLGLIALWIGLNMAMPKMEFKPKVSVSAPAATKTEHSSKTERSEKIDSEVQSRLQAAGFKTDSFTAVKTETTKTKKD